MSRNTFFDNTNIVSLIKNQMAYETKIITTFNAPPIPIRGYDWSAVREDSEDEDCIVGYGETEQEAIQDLLDKESL